MSPREETGPDPLCLSREWEQRAREELNEEPETARSNIELLRSLALSETNLYPETDDIFLLAFLRARKHNVEEAFKLLKNYYRLKKQFPKHLEDSMPTEKPFAYDMNGFTVLAEKDQHDRIVVGIRVEEVDLNVVRQEHFFQVLVTMLTVYAHDPLVQITGITLIVDMTGFSLRKASIVTPTFARIAIRIMQDSFPMRMKAIHIVHEPFYFDAIFALFKPFLKEKLRRRIHLYGHDLLKLHSLVPRRILPPNLDGLASDWNFRAFRREIQRNESKLKEWRKYGYGKRPQGVE